MTAPPVELLEDVPWAVVEFEEPGPAPRPPPPALLPDSVSVALRNLREANQALWLAIVLLREATASLNQKAIASAYEAFASASARVTTEQAGLGERCEGWFAR